MGYADHEARRAGEVLHAVAAALPEIPFGDLGAVEIGRITAVTLERDASLEAPLEVRARAAGTRECRGGRRLVVIECQLTNRSGDRVAAFSVETEAETPSAPPEPDLDCVDNIPV